MSTSFRFQSSSLARLFRECSFEPTEVEETYAGQSLTIHATTGRGNAATSGVCPEALERLVEVFSDSYQAKITFSGRSRWARRTSQGQRPSPGVPERKRRRFGRRGPHRTSIYVWYMNPCKQRKFMIGNWPADRGAGARSRLLSRRSHTERRLLCRGARALSGLGLNSESSGGLIVFDS